MGNVFTYVISPSYGMDGPIESNNDQGLKFQIKGAQHQNRITSLSSLEQKIKRIEKKQRGPSLQAITDSPEVWFQIGKLYEDGQGISKDFNEAMKCYLKAAEQNYIRAQVTLAEFYLKGVGVKQDYKKAMEWYHKAQTHSIFRNYLLNGAYYYNDEEVTCNTAWVWDNPGCFFDDIHDLVSSSNKKYSELIEWYRAAEEKNDSSAQFKIGRLYYYGFYTYYIIDYGSYYTSNYGYDLFCKVIKDSQEALKWYLKAAEQNHAEAQFHVGILYATGRGTKRDPEMAERWFNKAVTQDIKYAKKIGDLYFEGCPEVEKNYPEAVKWHLRAAEQTECKKDNDSNWMGLYRSAQEPGLPDTQLKLGKVYEIGEEVTRNPMEATHWFTKAINQDIKYAVKIGNLYYYGLDKITKDYTKAREWYQKAADQNNPEAQWRIGVMYECGQGIEQNYAKALEWYLKAAKQNHAEAQDSIGVFYREGKGVEQDLKKSEEWVLKAVRQKRKDTKEFYQKAANNNNAAAQWYMGELYEYGQNVEQSYAEAMKWYLKAAEHNREAQYKLGFRYHLWLEDYTKAMEWYLKAAEHNHSEAQNSIGLLYEWGQGVTLNLEEAKRWYRLAADNGSEGGKVNLKRLSQDE